jgi:hypothetical protein
MKTLIPFLLGLSILVACNTGKKEADPDNTDAQKKNVTKRDYSITRANAYNDLFVDSNEVEKFLAENQDF